MSKTLNFFVKKSQFIEIDQKNSQNHREQKSTNSIHFKANVDQQKREERMESYAVAYDLWLKQLP